MVVEPTPPVTAGSSLAFKPPPLEFAKSAAIITFNLSRLWGVHTGKYWAFQFLNSLDQTKALTDFQLTAF